MTPPAPPAIIDAHIHTWDLNDGRNIWIRQKISALSRSFSLTDFKHQNAEAGVQSVYIVQAAANHDETLELLKTYKDDPFVAGVIGWLDLAASNVSETLEGLTAFRKFSGVRAHPPYQFDMAWLRSPSAVEGMKHVKEKKIPIDFLINCTELGAFQKTFDDVPGVTGVLNHGGRPFVMTGDTKQWAIDLSSIARNTNCQCKLSGLVERAGVEWNSETLKPWIAILLETFGPDRLLFASNWPVMTLMATPQIWVDSLNSIFDDLGVDAASRNKIYAENAKRIYSSSRH